jgi:hypothetical protein
VFRSKPNFRFLKFFLRSLFTRFLDVCAIDVSMIPCKVRGRIDFIKYI